MRVRDRARASSCRGTPGTTRERRAEDRCGAPRWPRRDDTLWSLPTVADVIAAALRRAGVRHLFGVPGGGSSLDLIDAAQRAGLRFVLTATETAGAIAAIAQAEIGGAPGVCVTGVGPGAASVVNGVACAFLDRAPLVVFADAHPAAAAGSPHQRL